MKKIKDSLFFLEKINYKKERIESDIRILLSKILQKKVNDTRLKLFTITKIKISSDLSFAKVFITSSDKTIKINSILDVCNNASKFIKKELSLMMHLRKTPNIKFYEDKILLEEEKIYNILSNL